MYNINTNRRLLQHLSNRNAKILTLNSIKPNAKWKQWRNWCIHRVLRYKKRPNEEKCFCAHLSLNICISIHLLLSLYL